ncbi:unnamed protein product [Prunus brigantina]
MAKEMGLLGSWVEVAPALLISPNKTSTCPELETIAEEWELELEELGESLSKAQSILLSPIAAIFKIPLYETQNFLLPSTRYRTDVTTTATRQRFWTMPFLLLHAA